MFRRLGSSKLPCILFAGVCALTATLCGEEVVAPKPASPPADVPAEHAQKMAKGLAMFTKQVRTILVDRCVKCHGKDAVEGKLNLATREGLLQGGATGPAIVIGDEKNVVFDRARDSLLYRLITHADEPHMPFEEDKLSDQQIEMLAAWIDQGAPYDKPLIENITSADAWTKTVLDDKARAFWAYRPLSRVAPPAVKNPDACLSPVDNFVESKLEERNLEPNPQTDRRHLIRRAYFDLIGLPPEPDDVDAFVGDASPDAYSRLLDRLLASPHYGERWGRHWLDLARFAESHGFEHDYDRETAYHYRDFVIEALNDDRPYDQFVKWQLAGDELAPDNNLAMMATGFLAAGVHSTQITANEVEKHRYDELDDIVQTTGTAMLGLTIGCARCHDHKFDPIPAADYYRMISAFTTTVRSEVELQFDKDIYERAKAEFDRQHAPVAAALNRYEAEQLPARFADWEKSRSDADLPRWTVLDVDTHASSGGATFTKLDDGSLLVGGENPKNDIYTLTAHTNLSGIRAFRLEALPDPTLPKGGPGRAENGDFTLSDFRVSLKPNSGAAELTAVALSGPRATFEPPGMPASAAIDGDGKSAWGVGDQAGRTHAAMFVTESNVGSVEGSTLTFTLKFENKEAHNLGRLRLCVWGPAVASDALADSSVVPLDADASPAGVLDSLHRPAEKRSPEQTAAVLKWFRYRDSHWQELKKRVDDDLAQAPRPNLVKVLVCGEGLKPLRLHTQGADYFEQTFFLRRGDPAQKHGVAEAGYLQVLMTAADRERHWSVERPQGAKSSFRRSALADWITDAHDGAGHLLARVIVNRLWQHHMGRGIVSTPSDFGARGTPPSHPELLDWLATELIRHNWRLKPIHKLIMSSAAYCRTSTPDEAKSRVDADNALFWRQQRRRLEGEVIRDALLTAGGRLDERMFGPGTLDPSHRRRSIYFTVKRSKLVPMMQVFDAPEALSGVGERSSTTIAPQALLLLNNPEVRACAFNFARRLAAASDRPLSEVVKDGYRTAVGRPPDDSELRDGVAFIEQQQRLYAAEAKPNARDLAFADFCQVLICLNEFVYVE